MICLFSVHMHSVLQFRLGKSGYAGGEANIISPLLWDAVETLQSTLLMWSNAPKQTELICILRGTACGNPEMRACSQHSAVCSLTITGCPVHCETEFQVHCVTKRQSEVLFERIDQVFLDFPCIHDFQVLPSAIRMHSSTSLHPPFQSAILSISASAT